MSGLSNPLHEPKPHELNSFGRAGPHNKNPVQNEAPQMPEDVQRFHKDGKDYELHGSAHHGLKNVDMPDPAGGEGDGVTNQLIDSIENLTPERGEHILTTAEDTITGATSKDVHSGVGVPIYGMSSRQMHTANQQQHRKRIREGAEQYGPQAQPKSKLVE